MYCFRTHEKHLSKQKRKLIRHTSHLVEMAVSKFVIETFRSINSRK